MQFDPRFGAFNLSSLALFQGLDELTLATIAERLEVIWVAAGQDLFLQGEQADALYVLMSGAMVAIVERGNDSPQIDSSQVLGEIRAGETVGEMAMLSGKPRSATVRATRDSEVLRFKRSDFDALVATEAASMLQIARVAFQRLEQSRDPRPPRRTSHAFALLPASVGVDVLAFTQALSEAMSRFGTVICLRETDCQHQSSTWFHQIEQQYGLLLYVSEQASGAWFELCKRQSDEWLWLAAATQTPIGAALTPNANSLKRSRCVLQHATQVEKATALRWRKALGVSLHHHLVNQADIDRLARELTGFSTGLVLGGGGARGFAHLGVVKALREHGMQIDRVAGTSIGAIVGSGIAMQYSDEELYHRYHRSFVESSPLRDYTFPFIALVAGRKATARLKFESEDRDITDSWLPYVCVSTNLTLGVIQEYHEGPQWHALRASIAIPGVLSPVFHQGQVFVDGGVMNNLPVDVMRRDHAGKIISVDIAGDYAIRAGVEEANLPSMWTMMRDWFKGIRPRPSILQILLRAGMVNSASVMEQNRQQSNILIRPPIESIELLDWHAFDRAIEIGYRHTAGLIEDGKLG
jgi:NTE family protein